MLLWCQQLYGNSRLDLGINRGAGDYNAEFWEEIHGRLLLRTGRLQLLESNRGRDPREAIAYVLSCAGEEFLDFLEDIFSANCFFRVRLDETQAVDELNALLQQDDLPYHVTHFVKETVKETSGPYAGHNTIRTHAHPRVIMKESEVLHAQAVAPALALLQGPHFQGANSEYLAALEDYRKGDIGDCLTKCGSAFESVLKVICDRKGWSRSEDATAKTLINVVLKHTDLDTYFEQLLIIVATLRNKLSSSHGAGSVVRSPAPHLAQYALNATASAILLIARETNEY